MTRALLALLFAWPAVAWADDAKPAAPAKPPAADVLADALKRAGAEKKVVFLSFGGPGCVWCKYLDRFHARPEVVRLLGPHVVFAKVDTADNPGGEALYAKFFPKPGGVPAWVVLSAPEGKVLGDSLLKGENVGFPGEPAEVIHYEAVMRKALPKLPAAELTAVVAELKDTAPKPDPAAVARRAALAELAGVWRPEGDAPAPARAPGSPAELAPGVLAVAGESFALSNFAGELRPGATSSGVRELDLVVRHGFHDGWTVPAISELKGGTLRLALPKTPRPNMRRPVNFEPSQGVWVLVLTRDAAASAEATELASATALRLDDGLTPRALAIVQERKAEQRFRTLSERLERLEKRLEAVEKK